jgi:hypothetical protein
MKAKYTLLYKNLFIVLLILSCNYANAAPDADGLTIAQFFDKMLDQRNSKLDKAKERKRHMEEVNSTIKSNRRASKSVRQAINNEKDIEDMHSDIVPAQQDYDQYYNN